LEFYALFWPSQPGTMILPVSTFHISSKFEKQSPYIPCMQHVFAPYHQSVFEVFTVYFWFICLKIDF
jgi:hypothetical protein